MQAKRRELQQATSRYVQEKQLYDKIRKRRRRGLYRRLTAYSIVTAFLSIAFLLLFMSQHAQMQDKLNEKERLEKELTKVQQMEQDLKEEVRRLNDPEYVGEIARRDYLLSKDGEIIFKLPSDSSTN